MSPVIEVHAQAIQVAPDGPAPTGTFPASSVDLRVDEQGVVWLAASWPVFAAWCAPLSDEQNQVAAIEEIYQWNGSALTFAAAVPPVCGLPGRVRWAAGAGDPALAVYPYNLQEKVFRIDAPAVKALPQPPGVALAFGHSQGRLVGLVVVPDPASDGVRYGRDSWALLIGKPVLQSVRYDGAGWVVGGSLPVPPCQASTCPARIPSAPAVTSSTLRFPGRTDCSPGTPPRREHSGGATMEGSRARWICLARSSSTAACSRNRSRRARHGPGRPPCSVR